MRNPLPIIAFILLSSCQVKKGPVANPEDYNAFLRNDLQKDLITICPPQSSSFNHLLNEAKQEDDKGNLDKAISLVEQASDKMKEEKAAVYCPVLFQLATMYGRAGKIQQSYDTYLRALQRDSSYICALKGIAWIAYSHDKNTAEAKRILQYILSHSGMPDLWLTLAGIEEWEGHIEKKMDYIHRFMAEVEQPAYTGMYNKYLVQLYTGEMLDLDKAMQLAEHEVANHPGPDAYSLLAWVYFKKGDHAKAIQLTMNYVYKVNFKPDVVLHTALIFAANGKKKEACELLKNCQRNSFEMGPVAADEVKRHLWMLENEF